MQKDVNQKKLSPLV